VDEVAVGDPRHARDVRDEVALLERAVVCAAAAVPGSGDRRSSDRDGRSGGEDPEPADQPPSSTSSWRVKRGARTDRFHASLLCARSRARSDRQTETPVVIRSDAATGWFFPPAPLAGSTRRGGARVEYDLSLLGS